MLYCCVQVVEIYTEQRAFENAVNLLREIRVNDGFEISKVVTSRLQTKNMGIRQKIEDVELQALLDENESQTQQLVVPLGVS